MTVHFYRRIEQIAGPNDCRADIYYPLKGQSVLIQIWKNSRCLDSRRSSPRRAPHRAAELLAFWAGHRDPTNTA